MKKLVSKRLVLCLSLVAVCISMIAQNEPKSLKKIEKVDDDPVYSISSVTKKSNDAVYSRSVKTSKVNDVIADNSDDVTIGYGGLDFYNFDNGYSSLNFWGLTMGAFSYFGGGFDMKLKACFDSEPGSGSGVDFLFNYSFGLTKRNDNMLCFHAKAGPSLMWWTKYEYEDDDYFGYVLKSDGHTCTVDCVLSLGLIGRVGKFAISGGYNWWFSKFKFDKKNTSDGLWVSVSYCMNSK